MGKIDSSMVGRRFNRLVVLSFSHKDKWGYPHWVCQCDCGKTKTIYQGSLKRSLTKSCGCIQKEFTINRQLKHGMSYTRIYQTWLDIKKRCGDPKNSQYHNYGGRGIEICAEWINSFEAFFAYVGDHPFEGAELDRKNNNGNYEAGNVRWVTKTINQRNKRNNKLVTYKGETMCAADWEGKCGISAKLLRSRLGQGWTDERALTQPHRYPSQRGVFNVAT